MKLLLVTLVAASAVGANGGLVPGSTAIEPSTASLLVQISPPAERMLIAPPLGSGLLNTLKLSPATSGRPGFRFVASGNVRDGIPQQQRGSGGSGVLLQAAPHH